MKKYVSKKYWRIAVYIKTTQKSQLAWKFQLLCLQEMILTPSRNVLLDSRHSVSLGDDPSKQTTKEQLLLSHEAQKKWTSPPRQKTPW